MKNYIVLSPTPTWPLDLGNKQYIASTLTQMSGNAKINFLLYAAEGDWRNRFDAKSYKHMVNQWESLHIIPNSIPVHRHAMNIDHAVDEWWDDAIGDYLQWRFSREQFHAFIVNYTWLSRALEFAPNYTAKILQTHDKFSGRRQIFERKGLPAEFFHIDEKSEAIALSRADVVIAIKEQEALLFKKMCNRDMITLPHINQMETAQPSSETVDCLKIGFLAGNNTVNKINLQDFLEIAIPIISKYLAPVKFVIGGNLGSSVDFEHEEMCSLIGYVDNVSEFYNSVDAIIVPIQFSTGLKIKFAEAVSFGKPVFSTSHASEGFFCNHRYMKCETFESLAEACVEVSLNRLLLQEMRDASLITYARTKSAIDLASDKLETQIKRHSDRIVVFSDCFASIQWSAQNARLLDISNYFKYLGYVDIVFPADTVLSSRLKAEMGNVHLLSKDLSDASNLHLRNIFKEADIIFFLSWDEECEQLIDGSQAAIFIDGGIGRVEKIVSNVMRAAPKSTISIMSNSIGAIEEMTYGPRVDCVTVPYFKSGIGKKLSAWLNRESTNDLVWLLTHSRRSQFNKDYVSAMKRIFDGRLQIQEISFDGASASKCLLEFETAVPSFDRPQIIIDFSDNVLELNAVREIFWRAGIPIFYIDRVSIIDELMSAIPFTYKSSACKYGLYDLVSELLSFGSENQNELSFAGSARLRLDYMFKKDAGWSGIWRRTLRIFRNKKLSLLRI